MLKALKHQLRKRKQRIKSVNISQKQKVSSEMCVSVIRTHHQVIHSPSGPCCTGPSGPVCLWSPSPACPAGPSASDTSHLCGSQSRSERSEFPLQSKRQQLSSEEAASFTRCYKLAPPPTRDLVQADAAQLLRQPLLLWDQLGELLLPVLEQRNRSEDERGLSGRDGKITRKKKTFNQPRTGAAEC